MDKTHWITVASEKVLLAIIGVATCLAALQHLYNMYLSMEIMLADLFLLFIFTEILAMVAAFYSSKRIPVTLPITSPTNVVAVNLPFAELNARLEPV